MRTRPDIVIKISSQGSANLTHIMAHPARLWKQVSLSIGALLGNLEGGGWVGLFARNFEIQ